LLLEAVLENKAIDRRLDRVAWRRRRRVVGGLRLGAASEGDARQPARARRAFRRSHHRRHPLHPRRLKKRTIFALSPRYVMMRPPTNKGRRRVPGRRDHKRALIYSHDTFGLGHLRRCRAIAHSLVEANPSLSVLILSGSPIIGSFDFRSRVDFVRIPGVIKLRNGEYVSLNLHIDIEETLALRSSIIR